MKTTLRAVMLAFAVGLLSLPAFSEPVKLRIAYVTVPDHLIPLVEHLAELRPDIFPGNNKTYSVELFRFQGSTPQITALAAHEIDIASFGPSTLVFAVNNAHLDMRVIADVLQSGVNNPGLYYAVLKDGPIQKIEDMKGHRAATNSIGGITDMLMRIAFFQHGLNEKDYVVIEAAFPSMLAMIESQKVDLAPVPPPFQGAFEATGKYRPLMSVRDIEGVEQVVAWASPVDFITAHRAALVDFLTDYMRAQHWFFDPANREQVLDIAATVTKQSRDNLNYLFMMRDSYRAPDMMPNVPAMQKEIDLASQAKLMPARVDVTKYLDLSLVTEAKKRLDAK